MAPVKAAAAGPPAAARRTTRETPAPGRLAPGAGTLAACLAPDARTAVRQGACRPLPDPLQHSAAQAWHSHRGAPTPNGSFELTPRRQPRAGAQGPLR